MTSDRYPLVLDDGGRSDDPRHYRQSSDCTVRALAIATLTPYPAVYAELAMAGRKACDGFDLAGYLARRRTFMGCPVKTIRFTRRTTLDDVFRLYPKGNLVVELPDHVMAIIDGVSHDTFREPGDRRATRVWLFS